MSDYVRSLRERVGPRLLELPSVTVAIRDGAGRILMGRHRTGGRWLLPGGAIEPEERPADAAVREAWEETGLHVRLERLLGVYGGPECTVEYENGDRTSYVMVVFEASPRDGSLRADDDEMLELAWHDLEAARGLPVARWVPPLLADLAAPADRAAFRAPTWTPPAV